MAEETAIETSSPKVTGHATGVVRLQLAQGSLAIEIQMEPSKLAAFTSGARFDVETREDGSILLQPESAQTPAIDEKAFEKCLAEVLVNRKELLERLAK